MLRAGPTLATPRNVLRGESLPPRAAHADRWEDTARPPWQWLSHCARWADLSGFESLAHVVWPWAPGRDTASVSLSRSHLQAGVLILSLKGFRKDGVGSCGMPDTCA